MTRQHEWWQWNGLTCCKKCGIVQRRDGKNGPCKGHVKVGPRKEAEQRVDQEASE